MSAQPDGLRWVIQLQVNTGAPGRHWPEPEWRRTYERAYDYWYQGVISDFQHIWNGSRLPYARAAKPVEKLAADLAEWREQNESTLIETEYASVKLDTFRVILIGVWDEDLAVIDVLGDTVEWHGAGAHY